MYIPHLDPRVLKHLTGGVSLRGRDLHQMFDKVLGLFGDLAPVAAGERDLTKQSIRRQAGPALPNNQSYTCNHEMIASITQDWVHHKAHFNLWASSTCSY